MEVFDLAVWLEMAVSIDQTLLNIILCLLSKSDFSETKIIS